MQQTQLGNRLTKTGGTPDAPPPAKPALSLKGLGLRLLGLAIIDAVAVWFALTLLANNNTIAAVALLVVTALVNWVFLSERLYPLRWITPGVLLLILMVLYPLVFTVYVSLTNYGDGNRLSREQVVSQLTTQVYQPPNAATYTWTAYRNPQNQLQLLLQNKAQGQSFVGDASGLKPYNGAGEPPATLGDYQKLTQFQAASLESQLNALKLKRDNLNIEVTSSSTAREVLSRYSYDQGSGKLTDRESNLVYTPVEGVFTAPDGKELLPGFTSVVGTDNYTRIFSDSDITGPFLRVFIWTLLFAFFSVFLSFAVGLGLAFVLNDKELPFRAVFRSIIIIPYTIPAFISALVWAGLFNIDGPIGLVSKSIFGSDFSWFADPNAAKAAIIFVNVWLGFPYMMLICLGALQSIPTDMYEAASIDGASPIQKFWNLTLPLLLVSVAPLLIGSFAFNFNNFTIIELLTRGNPPDPTTATPAGQTDILISYTYRLAFASGKGSDLGLASTISLIIFLIVAVITIINFRFTKRLEGVLN